MGNCVSLKALSECNVETNSYSVGTSSMRGCRRTMQDRYSICLSFANHPNYALFGIFDGFNGHSASEYLSKNLVKNLNELNTLNDDELIINEINKMDQTFLKSKDENINISSGSTMVFALIEDISKPPLQLYSVVNSASTDSYTNSESLPINPQILSFDSQKYKGRIFWVGDSGAVLIKEDTNDFETLTTEHHCDVKDELIRIKKANGKIINNKIDGVCELSRCFGCESMKNNKTLQDNEQKMICVAQCKHISFQSEEKLILFSDGLTQLWNHNHLIKRYNCKYIENKKYKNPLQNTLIDLSEECMDNGSKDNITVISVMFQ